MTFSDHIPDFIIAHRVHFVPLLHNTCGFHSNKRLAQRNRTESAIKEEQAFVGVDVEEPADIEVVGKRRGEADDPDHGLR